MKLIIGMTYLPDLEGPSSHLHDVWWHYSGPLYCLVISTKPSVFLYNCGEHLHTLEHYLHVIHACTRNFKYGHIKKKSFQALCIFTLIQILVTLLHKKSPTIKVKEAICHKIVTNTGLNEQTFISMKRHTTCMLL